MQRGSKNPRGSENPLSTFTVRCWMFSPVLNRFLLQAIAEPVIVVDDTIEVAKRVIANRQRPSPISPSRLCMFYCTGKVPFPARKCVNISVQKIFNFSYESVLTLLYRYAD